jgi:hypothetical protein
MEFVFLRPVRSTGHVVYSSASGTENVNALFFMLGSAHCSFHIKRVRTHYSKLVFLRSVGSAGHIVHSGAFGARNIDILFSIKSAVEQIRPCLCFCIWWDPHVTQCIAVHPGRETSMHYLSSTGGLGAVFIKSTSGQITLNLYFCIRWNL